MNFRFSLIITMIAITHLSYTQSRWLQEYFPGLDIVGEDFVECYDKGYLMTGKFGPNYVHYCWLLKTDINGQVIWYKTFGTLDSYIAFFSMDQDRLGNIFLSGGTTMFDSYSDPLVFKINACGEKEWCLDFSTPGHFDYAHSIVATGDGGCAVILRYTGVFPPQTDRICLARIDANGTLLWKHCYNSQDIKIMNEDAYSLFLAPDKGFLISGRCGYLDSLTNQYWSKPYLIKLDSSGILEWERVIHAYDSNYTGGTANYSTISPSGQFYYSSISHYYYYPETERPALGKMDLNGNVIGVYDIIQGYENGGLSSAQFINDSILAAVCGWGNGMEDFSHYLALIDTLGNIVDTIPISQDIYSGVLQICQDNKLAVMYNTNQNDQFDVYLRKLNFNLEDDTLYTRPFTYDSLCPYQIVSDTIVPDDCGLIVGVEEHGGGEAGKQGGTEAWGHGGMQIWPNPCRDVLNVECSMLNAGKSYSLVVIDIFGRLALSHIQNTGSAGDGSLQSWTIDVSSLPSGVFYIAVMNENKRITGGKFVVAR